MVSENHVVVDISSDEEEEEEEEVKTQVELDYSNWLYKVIEEADGSTHVVQVLSEVKGGVDSQYRKLISSSQAVEDDDDDCVILDGDPDKTTKTSSLDDDDNKLLKNHGDDDDDDDDVLVVGQKGEIACRDFPHPRHSCAKYAFSSTSHEKYCDMCHCYVCDIRAPCPYWCIGGSSIAHCHANDKEMIWKNQREQFRPGYVPPTPPSSKPIQNLLRISQSTLPRNQVVIRPCSISSTIVGNPPLVRTRLRVRKSTPQHPGLQNQPVQSLNSVRSGVIQKQRSSYRIGLRSRVASYAGNGNSVQVGLYSNGQVSQSSSAVVAPTINSEVYTQQRNHQQPNVSDHCTALPVSESICGSGNRQFQTNGDLSAPPEAPLTPAGSQIKTTQQQLGTNGNAVETNLSEFENWLLDSSNHSVPFGSLPESVSQDYAGPLTFDIETFLND